MKLINYHLSADDEHSCIYSDTFVSDIRQRYKSFFIGIVFGDCYPTHPCEMLDDVGSDIRFRVQILLCKGGLDKDSTSTIAMIVRVFLLTCMLGPLEKDEKWSLPRAGLPSHVLL